MKLTLITKAHSAFLRMNISTTIRVKLENLAPTDTIIMIS